jgi:peroxiredoxin
MLKIYTLIGYFLIILSACHSPKNSGKSPTSAEQAGKFSPAPDFETLTQSGKNFKLSAYKGKVVLVNFWFSQCPPCITEILSLNQLQTDFQPKGLEIIGIGLDESSKINELIAQHKIQYPTAAKGQKIADEFKVSRYPTSFLIDKKGNIRQTETGASDWDATYTYIKLKPMVEKLLAE